MPMDCDTFYWVALPMYQELLAEFKNEAKTNIIVKPACDFIATVIIRIILIYRFVEQYYTLETN